MIGRFLASVGRDHPQRIFGEIRRKPLRERYITANTTGATWTG